MQPFITYNRYINNCLFSSMENIYLSTADLISKYVKTIPLISCKINNLIITVLLTLLLTAWFYESKSVNMLFN